MVDGFSCIVDFPSFSGGGGHKWNTSIKPLKIFLRQQQTTKGKKALPIKTIYKKYIFRLYRNWKREEGAGAISFLCDL